MHEELHRPAGRFQGSCDIATRLRPLAMCVALAVSSMLSAQPARAQDGDVFGRYWGAYATVNYSVWDGLGDVMPIGRGGPFETDGAGIDFGGYFSVARLGSAWVLAGGELGFLGLNSDVIFEPGSFSGPPESRFEVNHIVASAALRFGQPASRYIDFGIGLGQYIGDTKYIDCSVILRCFGAETSDRPTGLSLSISGSPGLGIVLGARIHLVDFDPIEAVDLGMQGLDGPIYSIFVGWEFSNWRRD